VDTVIVTSGDETPEHLLRLVKRRKGLLPDWLDIDEVWPSRPDSKGRIVGWIEGADLRQLNRDIREYLAIAYKLKNGETVVVVNVKRNRVVLILKHYNLVFHTSRYTGKLSAELSVGNLIRKIFP
tara:strand:- start:3892 stop:4266 length:375 start_codon:yes stop_codon:yes gene_type:complete